jgi:hypothetical protein
MLFEGIPDLQRRGAGWQTVEEEHHGGPGLPCLLADQDGCRGWWRAWLAGWIVAAGSRAAQGVAPVGRGAGVPWLVVLWGWGARWSPGCWSRHLGVVIGCKKIESSGAGRIRIAFAELVSRRR